MLAAIDGAGGVGKSTLAVCIADLLDEPHVVCLNELARRPRWHKYAGRVEATIRAYEQRDAGDLAEVFFRSVRQVAISDYTPAQVRAWAPERRTAEWSHQWASDGRLVLLATNENDRAIAFIDLEPDGHIDHLFCAPEAAGQGIASQLYEATETAARQQEISRLYTEASELARRFFERQGFVVLERQDMVIRGEPIHNYKMAKGLAAPVQ